MHIKDLPVVMLAAGLSKRFNPEHRIGPKSLLPIDSHLTIFDAILNNLINCGIYEVSIILGYQSHSFKQYIQEKYLSKKIQIKPILANNNFIKGPIFTLLTLLDQTSFEKFIVIPSDTIFHPVILKQIFSKKLLQTQDICTFFTLEVTPKKILNFNNVIPFSPYSIDRKSDLYPLIEHTPKPSKFILFPLLILSREFLKFTFISKNRISNKIIDNLGFFYRNTERCSQISLQYNYPFPPFIDIDTSQIYNSLNSVKKELFESYKVK
jgi:NDP-sugar pyrophosphorylase family protein